jgi:hypothetical protein
MKRFSVRVAATVLGWGIICCLVEAGQQPGSPQNVPYSRPTVSPYLYLLRRGSLSENYFSLTRPQIQFQNETRRLQQEITQTRQETAQDFARRDLPATGHTTSFLNLGSYFLNRGGGVGPSRGTTSPPPSGGGRPAPRSGRGS